MGHTLDAKHLKRYKDLTRLFLKYGRSDLRDRAGLDDTLPDEDRPGEEGEDTDASGMADDLEEMGPTFVKLGQLLSTRPDLFPPEVLKELSRLQDRVEPFDEEEVTRIVEEELGVRISKAFREFSTKPLAAASLAQVHSAVLRDGRPVAVKVQRPGIRSMIRDDMEVLEDLADTVEKRSEAGKRYAVTQMLEEFKGSLMQELDFRKEARNLEALAENLKEFDRIVVPQPVEDYTTSRVLTMDFVAGRKITSLSPLARMEMEGEALAEQLFQAYLKQILVDGFFHADPHPGNVFLTDDGQLALIDLGMVARIAPSMQEKLLKLLLAVSEGRGEDAAEIAIGMGTKRSDFEEKNYLHKVSQLVERHQDSTVEDIDIGRVVMELNRLSAEHGIRLPADLTMLGKTLLNLDEVGRTLDPTFDPNAAIRRHAADIMQRRMLKSASPANLFSSVLEMNDFMQRLPARLNRVLDTVADNELRMRVDAFDEVHMMEGLQKIANRITIGLILAALIIGAAMLMQVDTDFQILGYPGLAMICFLAAAVGGVILVVEILLHDEKQDKTPPPR